MMDPSIGWYQPEHNGPALDLWKHIWKEFNLSDESDGKSIINSSKICFKFVAQLCRMSDSRENPSSTYDLNNNQHLIRKYNGTPWRKLSAYYGRGIEGLNQEIEDFYQYMKPNREEVLIRLEVLQRITRLIELLWPQRVTVQCFGSYKTQTYLPTSDIDIVVIGDWNYCPLIELEQHLIFYRQCLPTEIRVLDRAAIPIIKMTDFRSRIRINISFNLPEVCKSVALVNNYIKDYPNLQKLVYVIKQFVLQRDLNEVFRGGLSSYSLVLMVVHFFQTNPDTLLKPICDNLGVLLIRFFELYGRKLNYEKVGLRVSDGTYVEKTELLKNMESRHTPSLLCIEDPLNATNNVSKNSYAVEKIRDAFDYAFDILYRAIGPNNTTVDQTKTILGRIILITDEVIDKREAVRHKYLFNAYVPDLRLNQNRVNGNYRQFNGRPNRSQRKPFHNNNWNRNPQNRNANSNGSQRYNPHHLPTGDPHSGQHSEPNNGYKNRNGLNKRFENGFNGHNGHRNYHQNHSHHNHQHQNNGNNFNSIAFYSFERYRDQNQKDRHQQQNNSQYKSPSKSPDNKSGQYKSPSKVSNNRSDNKYGNESGSKMACRPLRPRAYTAHN